jgi:membrane-associated phospholipid phosphatase
VGRPRPYTAAGNDHPELRRRRSQDNLSFFSGHAATTFAAGVFLAEDLSRAVRRRIRARSTRLLLGTVLPFSIGYGLPTFISLSRVVDQQHWPSDVAMGAAIGALIAHGTYALHFDAAGHPRRRHPARDPSTEPRGASGPRGPTLTGLGPVPLGGGPAGGGFALAATGTF